MRRSRLLGNDAREDFSVVQSATLTLLALVIGFNPSMAVSRYDQRKNYEEEEANAIGTQLLRADLLPAGDAATLRSLLAKYLELRIRYYQSARQAHAGCDQPASGQLQNEMWNAVHAPASRRSPTRSTRLRYPGMNDVINRRGYTQAEWSNRIPRPPGT